MNKTNELIEKANARARSQSSSRAGTPTKSASQEPSEGSTDEDGDFRQKRIKSGGGRVVVRRRNRAPAREEAAPVEAAASEPVAAQPVEATEATVQSTPEPAGESSAPEAVSAPVQEAAATADTPPAVATAQSTPKASAKPSRAKPAGPPPKPPAIITETSVKRDAATQGSEKAPAKPTQKRSGDSARVLYRPPAPGKQQKKGPPSKGGARGPGAGRGPAQGRTTAPAKASAKAAAPAQGKAAAQPAKAAAQAAPVEAPPRRAPVRTKRRVARSLEEVLAEESGYVPQQRTAVVVAPAPLESARRRPAGPAGAAGTASTTASTTGTPREAKKVVPGQRAPLRPEEPGRGGVRKRRRARGGRRGGFDDFGHGRRRKGGRKSGKKTILTTPKASKRIVNMDESITVAELAHQLSVKASGVIKQLMGMGVMATMNQSLDFDTASLVATEFNYEVKSIAFDETAFIQEVTEEAANLEPRAPVVTIMGHVDHGKTTLLDYIRKSSVADGEAGGITQHIGAYQVGLEGGDIIFLDTPGHEAFTAMRERGAQVTDIVILVVSADDGVMPQTIEAIKHSKAAEVPIIVAVNKIDKAGAQPEVVQRKLAEHGLVPEAWGGDTIICPVSAKVGTGVNEMLELVLLQAEMLELQADPTVAARCTVIEAELDKGRGPVATVLIQNGTLHIGDYVVAGQYHGRVRAMLDELSVNLEEAGPSTPVQILGLNGVPPAGEMLAVVKDGDVAKQIAEDRGLRARQKALASSGKISLDDFMRQLKEDDPEEVRLIVKAGVQGALQALTKSIDDLSTDKVRVNIIHTGVGSVSEGDVSMASTSGAMIVGFNVSADNKGQTLADQSGVVVSTHTIIYEALDEIRTAMVNKLPPILKEKVSGHAEVREMFSIPKVGVIGGSMVLDGKIVRNGMARLLRGGKQVWQGKVTSLKRFKDDAREVEKGFECGIGLENFTDLRPEDVVEAFIIEEIAPTL